MSGLVEETGARIAGLAAQVASIRHHLCPKADRARSLLVMCEEDLLSAVDAWEKATTDLTPEDFSPITQPALPVPTVVPEVRPAARRPGRHRKLADGQQSLFAATGS
ncbi:hypothetical protein D1871_20290 [Nakamurella silvestris]|nr:hypothetical protein D1871_20290 [Nakamurella silvestris]